MMKNLLLFALLISTAPFLAAQKVALTFTPAVVNVDDVINMNDPGFEMVGYATVTNTSDAPISVRWNRVAPQLPMGWEVLVCDNESCYPPFVYSNVIPEFDLNMPVVLQPGGTTNMDVHVKPNQLPGSTVVTIQLTAANDTTVIATGTYHFGASITSSSSQPWGARQDIRVFPNPTTDYFQLTPGSKVSRVTVYNTLGRQVRTFDAYDGRRYSLAGLSDGMYLVSLIDGARGNIKTIRVIKRSFRP